MKCVPLLLQVALGWCVVALTGCGETVVTCPPNFTVEGTFCVCEAPYTLVGTSCQAALPPQDTGASRFDAGAQADTSVTDGGALDTGGVQDTGAQDTSPVDTSQVDAGPKDTGGNTSSSPIGAACEDDLDCFAGLSCFSYPKGYCTVLNCSSTSPCPGSAVCWGKDKVSQLCFADCEVGSDCREKDGYGCKRMSASFNGIDANLCIPTGKKLHGQTCQSPFDCEGDDTCLTDMAGGYCARLGCGANDPCGAKTACVLRDGKPTCLATCTGDIQCQVEGDLPRTCVERTDLSKKLVKVCLDSAKAAPVGAECGADLDCESGKCTLVANGGCKTGGASCLTDAQCGSNGPCVADKQKEKGVCSQPCAQDSGCPTSAVCVPGSGDTLSGTCQPACQGAGDQASCIAPGTECVFGQPIAAGGVSSPPTYACAPRPKGTAGSSCIALSDCASNDCTTNSKGTAGYCSATCGAGKPPCPFGTKCINTGLSFCERMCFNDYDCPIEMACKSSGSAGVKTCQIP